MNRAARAAGFLALASGVAAAATWAFLAYTRPGMVMDLAALLQLCGIALR